MVALFGYEVAVEVNVTDVPMTVINGEVQFSPFSTIYHAGRNLLAFSILVHNQSEIVSLSFGDQTQKIDANSTSMQCPKAAISFVISYPNATNPSNLTTAVKQLYSQAIPYPLNLTEVANVVAKRAVGDVQISLLPGTGVSPYISFVSLQSKALPQNAETGAVGSQQAKVNSASVPTIGGAIPPVIPPSEPPFGPPHLTSFATGAITICVLIGVLILLLILTGFVVSKTTKLPTATKGQSDKSVRPVNEEQKSILASQESTPAPVASGKADSKTPPNEVIAVAAEPLPPSKAELSAENAGESAATSRASKKQAATSSSSVEMVDMKGSSQVVEREEEAPRRQKKKDKTSAPVSPAASPSASSSRLKNDQSLQSDSEEKTKRRLKRISTEPMADGGD